jgi:proline iminopeptidase
MRIAVNGTELNYEVLGRERGGRTPIYLMHGGLGLDHSYFLPWLAPLSEHRTVVMWDHRGNGRSARPASLDGVSHGTWADDADALRIHLGHDRIVLLGHSYGGFIALEYALRHGSSLAGLGLCGATPCFDYHPVVLENARTRATPEQLDAVMQVFGGCVADDETLRQISNVILPLYFYRWDPAVGAELTRGMIFSAAAFMHGNARCLPTWNVEPRLAEIHVRTLVLAARHDWLAPLERGPARLQAGIADARMVVFEQSGHFPFVEESQRFLQVLGDWLDSIES